MKKTNVALVALGGGILVAFTALARKARGKGLQWWLRIPAMTMCVIQMRAKHIYKQVQVGDEAWFVAQFGEDRLLAEMFRGREGFCVEVGANDGVSGSNTFYLEKRGWRGILVEANPDLINQCRRRRSRSIVVNAAVVPPGTPPTMSFEIVKGHSQRSSLLLDDLHRSRMAAHASDYQTRLITVPAQTLDDILTQWHAPVGLQLISIDVEGHEWGVLQGLSLDRWQPEVVIVERNAHEPDERVSTYMKQHGYRYFCTTPTQASTGNDWFVRGAGPFGQGLPDKWKSHAAVHLRLHHME